MKDMCKVTEIEENFGESRMHLDWLLIFLEAKFINERILLNKYTSNQYVDSFAYKAVFIFFKNSSLYLLAIFLFHNLFALFTLTTSNKRLSTSSFSFTLYQKYIFRCL